MTNPSTADLFSIDMTTLYIINNLIKLGYGGFDVVNLVSTCTTKLSMKDLPTELESINVHQILKSAEKSSKIIIAWGKGGDNSQKLSNLQNALLKELKPHTKKIYVIADNLGRVGFHPLAPQIRFAWHLKAFVIPEPSKTTERLPETKIVEKNIEE